MAEQAGFDFKAKLHEGRYTLVHRAVRKSDGAPVVLKMLKDASVSDETFARFKREYEMTASLNTLAKDGEAIPGVIGAYAFETVHNLPTIVLEDFGGESLDLNRRVWSLNDFFQVSIQIAETLGQVHTRQIMHKDINPSNIVYNPDTAQAKLIDFGISTVLPRENIARGNVNVLEGTLAYISPEQTGRINRPVDYRTDFYSLGVTFYELLTGRRPFDDIDLLALLHSHLAKHPIPPHAVHADVPVAVSNIVMKLLAKNAEDRYQSAYGLKADLAECQRQWQADRIIREFPVAQKDVSDRFQISQALYGREMEIQQLLAAFERTKNGGCEVVLVTGEAGMGKTSLVNELQIPISQQNGYFISGRYLQSQSQTPYSALVDALRSLIQQLLSESEERLAAARTKIEEAVGVNGQVIVDMIPEAARVLGVQQPLQPLSPEEEQNRFNFTLQNFIESFLSADTPLVLFLDNIQWADLASSSFLQRFAASPELHHILIVGSVRAGEITADHPLNGALQKFRESGNTVHQIELNPLRFEDVNLMLAQTLNCPTEVSSPLSEITLAKTGGNPFFINEFLRSIHEEGLLRFDRERGGWVWDLTRIQMRQTTDNVVEIMSAKIGELPPETRQMLEIAACIGYEFDLSTLAALSHRTRPETASVLWHSLASGLIFPLTQNYLFAEQAESESEVRYSFSHVGIQQGIYNAISESGKQSIHWQVGQYLLERIPEDEQEQHIFDLVHHLNLGSDQIQAGEPRLQLARLNLVATQKTYVTAAQSASLQYAAQGLKQLQAVEAQGINYWEVHYPLAFDLHFHAASASYLTGGYDEMERLSDLLIENAASVYDQARVYEMKLFASISKDDRAEGLKMGLKALELLGLKYPARPGLIHVFGKLIQTQRNLRGKSDADILNLPETRDARVIAIGRVIRAFFTILYTNAPQLAPLVFMDLVNLTVKHGNFDMSPFGCICYGFILSSALGDLKGGDRFGKLAIQLVEKLKSPQAKGVAYFFHATVLQHWTEPLRNTLSLLDDGISAALSVGDFTNACTMMLIHDYHSFCAGLPLEDVERVMTANEALIVQFQQGSVLNYHRLWHQAALNMMGKGNDTRNLKGPLCDSDLLLPQHIAANERSIVMNHYLQPMIFHYLWDDFKTAYGFVQKIEPYLDGGIGAFSTVMFVTFDSLIQLGLWPQFSEEERRKAIKRIASNQKKLTKWAKFSPSNSLHKIALVDAELARVQGDFGRARELYDESARLAHEHKFMQDEALACELAGKFHLSRGMDDLAMYYLRSAYRAYQRWGAMAKVKHLEEKYSKYIVQLDQPRSQLSSTITSTTTTESGGAHSLDFSSILKSTQALSSEIVLDKLLASLLEVVIENAGAEKGWLLREQAGAWMVEAQVARGKIEVLDESQVGLQNLPQSIFSYVARTHENIVLDDAAQGGQFARDLYIVANKPKSVLCMPMLNQGRVSGLLYLENNLTTNAFTPERLEVIQVLASQAAISIDNARLYSDLKRNEERYRTLFEDSRDAIFVMTTDATIVDINQATLDLFGYTREEMLKLGLADIGVPLEAFAAFQKIMEEQGSARDYEVKLTRKDGIEMDALLTATLRRDDHGKAVAYQGILRDITERKRAERMLEEYSHNLENMVEERTEQLQRAREDAERANASKSIFLASMSHEIRTPMNGIIGMTGLLLNTELTSQQRDYADVIRASGETLLTIINDILDFSKIESGKMELEYLPFNLRECIESALDLVVPRAAEHHLDLACVIDDDVPQAISGDVTRLRQILLNLLSNAVKFTEQGEVVVLVSRDREAEQAGLKNYLQFAVRDTGIGIPRERMNRLFESFSQVDASTTRKYGGTGLGLVISKRLVELMGGEISVDSEGMPGRGSVFHFSIAGEPAEPAVAASRGADGHLLEGKRVLIVDDNDTNRRIFKLQTEKWGMLVHDTAFPRSALSMIERGEQFDLIVLDMFMPEIDGAMLAGEIRKLNPNTPLLLFSSLGQRDIGLDRRLFDAFLSKPLKPSLLFDTLAGLFDKSRSAPLTAPAKPIFDPEMGERHPLRILLAEDNAVHQQLALRLLEQMGYRADLASNGLEAIESLERQPYDVVLMDVQMPDMDGLEATRKIRMMQNLAQLRIIAMTANAMQGDREMCLAAGMDDYISKPIRVDELVDALIRSANAVRQTGNTETGLTHG